MAVVLGGPDGVATVDEVAPFQQPFPVTAFELQSHVPVGVLAV